MLETTPVMFAVIKIFKNSAPNSQRRPMKKKSARTATLKFGKFVDFGSRWLVSNDIPSYTMGSVGDSFFSQLLRGRNFFIGRHWELGAENLGLSCWNMLFETVGTDF